MISDWKEEEMASDEFYTCLVRGKVKCRVTARPQSPESRKWAAQVPQAGGDKVRWAMQENTPGFFPYTAGIYPFKRTGEIPRGCSPAR
ncbi:MAG: hypothetical protein IPL77_07385 [Flavobacteriales bacterium]|nr:hypothetical protein [Flavobacteriales bacterium]